MLAIVDLHHEIMMLELVIFGLVTWVLGKIIHHGLFYGTSPGFVLLEEEVTHNTLLEVV